MPALERLAMELRFVQETHPDLSLDDQVEQAVQMAAIVLTDLVPAGEQDDLETALRNWLYYVGPPRGAFGQSMENTMAYHATMRLRGAAARHLNERDNE